MMLRVLYLLGFFVQQKNSSDNSHEKPRRQRKELFVVPEDSQGPKNSVDFKRLEKNHFSC